MADTSSVEPLLGKCSNPKSLPFKLREPLGHHILEQGGLAHALLFGESSEGNRAIPRDLDVLLAIAP
jgi:hypothetical protein